MAETMKDHVNRETIYGVLPILSKMRQYNLLDLIFVAGSFGVATWCYVQGGTIASMVNFGQACSSTFGAILAFAFIVCLTGVISHRYGIDHWIYQRAVFGTRGVQILLFLALATTWGWYAINAQLYAQSMQKLAMAAGLGLGDGWLKPLGLSCIIIGWLVSLGGPAGVGWATKIMAPCLFIVGLIVTIMLFVKTSPAEIFAANPVGLDTHSGDHQSYMLVTEWNLAFILSWYPLIGALTRLVKGHERVSHWGIWVGYGVLVSWFILIATASALAIGNKLGFASSDPTDYLLHLGGPVFGLLSLVLIGIANITTQTIACYGLSVSAKMFNPTWNYRILSTLGALYVAILVMWGGVWEYYPVFLAITGVVVGPALAMIIVDYYVIRKQKCSVRDLYDLENSVYKYSIGFNVPAIISFAIGVTAFLLVYDPINYVPRSKIFYMTTATGLASFTSAISYWLMSLIPAVKYYLLKDTREAVIVGPSVKEDRKLKPERAIS